jgi:hypothetical protein
VKFIGIKKIKMYEFTKLHQVIQQIEQKIYKKQETQNKWESKYLKRFKVGRQKVYCTN